MFREPELQNLIRTALANNYDVRIAAQQVLEQQTQVRITRSQQFPTLSVGGTGIGAELPDSLSKSIGSSIYAGRFNLGGMEARFWGLYRRQTEAARAPMLAQVWAQRTIRMADSDLFSAQLNLINAQEGDALSLVQLYGALGGGWD